MKNLIGCTAFAVLSSGVSAQQAPNEERVTEQFRQIEQACKAAYAKSPRILQTDTGTWVRHQYISPSVSMAVKKTGAADEPYAGAIQVKYLLRPESAATEEAVTALPQSADVPTALVSETLRFAFQHGKWVGVDIEKVVRLKMKKDAALEPARTTHYRKDDLTRFATPAADCLVSAE